MKKYTRHNCTRKHLAYLGLAKCMFPKAAWVTGDGPYACLAWCRSLTVQLYATEAAAVEGKAVIDGTGCGGACGRRHEIVLLVMPD